MEKFGFWLVERALLECNNYLHEAIISRKLDDYDKPAIPELQLRRGLNIKNLQDTLLAHYRKEMGIQKPFGGIRNPSAVLVNKIRHEMTNYDEVRDALTRFRKEGNLSVCEELSIRIGLVDKVTAFVEAIINTTACPINVPDKCSVEKDQMMESNRFYARREHDGLHQQLRAYRCENASN